MTASARSVTYTATRVLEIVAAGGRWRDVEPVLTAADLTPEERIALVVLLLDVPASVDPHPADVVVAAFVAMRLEDFLLAPQPVDVREVHDLWLDLAAAEVSDAPGHDHNRP